MSSSPEARAEVILAVDRRHERRVQALDDVVCDPVALLLAEQDGAREVVVLGKRLQHLLGRLGCPQHVGGRFLEQVEETRSFGENARESRPWPGL